MVKIEINGNSYDASEGKTLLEVANENNIEIPSLCYNKALPPYASCRLCVVEIIKDGWTQIATSCTLPVMDGLRVQTHSEKVIKSRKMTIELLLSRCPEENVFLDLAKEYGIGEPRFKKKDDNCFFCGLCVRLCERMGVNAINFTGRGMDRELGTPYMEPSKVCMTCGACASICPTTRFTQKKVERISGNKPKPIPSEFNDGMEARHPIYIPFPQAVPKIPVIDKERCVYYLTGQCKTCENFCEAGAIEYDQKDESVDIDVGTIVVATGFDLFDPTEKPEYGYGKIKNVITGLEFERLVSASGPTDGHIEINGKEPKKVVFIQCVGSRDKEGNEYCSRVCCMYTAKHAHLVKDKLTNADITVYNTDVRAFGKGFEEFYNRVMDEGVNYRRRELDDPIEVVEKGDKAIVKAKGHPDIEADLVVLATAIVQRKVIEDLSKILKISKGADDFFLEVHPKLRPMDTATRGIFLAGCCQGPKDIPDTVAQASGAAAKASIPLAQGKIELDPLTSDVIDEYCDGCAYCIDPCPYKALTLIEYMKNGEIKKTVETNEALCQGCGVCQATCPKQGIIVRGYTYKQITAMIEALLSGST